MWKLYEAAKSATANASEYVATVQEKAHSIVATVQDEASILLSAIGNPKTGPIDEILYDEIEAYKAFEETFNAEDHTEEIEHVLASDKEIGELHEELVPLQLSFEEFWSRYFFRRKIAQQAAENMRLRQSRLSADSGESLEDKTRPSPTNSVHDDWKTLFEKCQQKLSTIQSQHKEERAEEQLKHEMQYQSLCDSYESRMVEMTLQIDDAKNAGMEEGIRESESIIASLKESHQLELDQIKQKMEILEQQFHHSPQESKVDESVEIARLQQALHSKAEELAICQEKLSDLTTDFNSQRHAKAQELERKVEQLELLLGNERDRSSSHEEAIAALEKDLDGARVKLQEAQQAQEALNQALHQANSQSEDKLKDANSQIQSLESELFTLKAAETLPNATIDSLKKELELWKVRAMKMKKLKEQVEADLEAVKSQSLATLSKEPQPLVDENEKKLHELSVDKENAFERGRKEGQTQANAALEEMKNEWMRKLVEAEKNSFDRGVASIRLEMEAQVTHLREELERSAIMRHPDAVESQAGATQDGIDTSEVTGKLQDWGEW
uniref:Uncharacterized protein AlNc14C139G7210 n=1 Tax=Albugo laibachii Nc14 TaxID=890382 RepID=F0WL21_9STRA|nr:conserved hypothetical protein [Albugo laibachii Nc14]|eukprot:CCA21980.1 conserved hypothetical protein [Albugo laibachii Nc14]